MSFIESNISTAVADLKIKSVIKTASDVLAEGETEKTIVYNNSTSSFIFEIPLEATESIEVGSWIRVRKTGSGDITIQREGSVSFEGVFGDVDFKLDGVQGFSCFLEKTSADIWIYSGNIKSV